jgi:hypothetical protein
MVGTPLKDIGPDPVCMPDPDNDPDAGKYVFKNPSECQIQIMIQKQACIFFNRSECQIQIMIQKPASIFFKSVCMPDPDSGSCKYFGKICRHAKSR